MPAIDFISRFLDSSATLGMTSFNKFRMSGLTIRQGNETHPEHPAIPLILNLLKDA